MALHERIEVNGRIVKPSYDVKIDDIIKITYGTRILTVKVLNVMEYVRKDDANQMYEIIDESFRKE